MGETALPKSGSIYLKNYSQLWKVITKPLTR
jgi:hypothetical protein